MNAHINNTRLALQGHFTAQISHELSFPGAVTKCLASKQALQNLGSSASQEVADHQ